MVYNQYKQKLEKIAKALNVIWRFRFIILGVIIVLISLACTLCGISGNVYGENFSPEVEYGTSLNFTTKAVFSTAKVQYSATASANDWSYEEPTDVGTYYMRGISYGVFGERHGKTYSFEIVACAVEIEFESDKFPYGGQPQTYVRLCYEDTVEEMEYKFNYSEDSNSCEVTATVLSIVNSDGKDVTDYYIIQPASKQFTCIKRQITITTGSASKTYDGRTLKEETFQITAGTLLEGSTIALSYPEFVNAGTYDNTPVVTIYDVEGRDMSVYYDVTIDCGTIEILPKEITISTGSASKVYDGISLSQESYEITEGSLLSGHVLVLGNYESITNVGTVENTIDEIAIYYNGEDLTGNYSVTMDYGTLEIEARSVALYTVSAIWIYDGEEHSASGSGDYGISGNTIYKLVDGHTLAVTAESVKANTITEITDTDDEVGYHVNALVFNIFDENGEYVTDNYELIYEYGNLRIKSEIIIALYNYSKYYDGTELTYKGGYAVVKKPPDVLVTDCTISTASITDAGTVSSDNFSIIDITIIDSDSGSNVKAENRWHIEENDIVLEVLKREIEVTSITVKMKHPGENGETLVDDTAWISLGSLVDGHEISITVTGELTTDDNSVVNTISEVVIYDEYGKDVTSNYYITYNEGTLSWFILL